MTEILIQKSAEKIGIFTKISYVLVGILFSSIVISAVIKIMSEYGVWIGLILATILSYFSIKKTKKGTSLRLIAYGFTGLTIFYAIMLIMFFTMIAGM